MHQQLQQLEAASNLRHLPALIHDGRDVIVNGQRMLNLSSNDYLGLAADRRLREEFLETLTPDTFLPTSSSSRLLTGNFTGYTELEQELAQLFGTEAALVFNSGYHANTGILPAVSDAQTLILADKLVHASLIDGIRLSAARCIRPLPAQRPRPGRPARRRASPDIQPDYPRHREHFQHGRR